MNVPGIVHSTLDGEEIATRLSLGGEDELFVTPRTTIIYRADGLLSDESIDEYPHDAERLTLSEGRRKTKFVLEYALDGTREFTVPSGRAENVLHPVLAGILNGNGITDSGESVVQTYRFSELTLILTSDRVVKHIGEAVWDGDYEEYHFDDVTGLSFEDGSVATQIVIEVDGRPQRIKAPNERADEVCERLKRALFSYHDVRSLEELNDHLGDDEDEAARNDPAAAFGEGVDPLGTEPPESETAESEAASTVDTAGDSSDHLDDSSSSSDPLGSGGVSSETPEETTIGEAETESRVAAVEGESEEVAIDPTADEDADRPNSPDAFEESGFEPAEPSADPEVIDRLDALEETVSRQTELLERQQATIEQLIEELRQGR